MKQCLKWLVASTSLVALGAAAINLYILLSTADTITTLPSELPTSETVIILGAAVYRDETLSPVLEARVTAALEVYQSGKVQTILVSGDNSTTQYNEVIPVRDYLLAAGVPASDIFTDFAGFDTYDSMYRAQSIFEVADAVVVTQSFHLPRAVFIGRALGMEVTGYVPTNDSVAFKNYVREFAARVKAYIDVTTHAEPRYYGERIPIDGDGRESLE